MTGSVCACRDMAFMHTLCWQFVRRWVVLSPFVIGAACVSLFLFVCCTTVLTCCVSIDIILVASVYSAYYRRWFIVYLFWEVSLCIMYTHICVNTYTHLTCYRQVQHQVPHLRGWGLHSQAPPVPRVPIPRPLQPLVGSSFLSRRPWTT